MPQAGTPEHDAVQQQATRVLFQRTVVLSEAAKHGLKVDESAVEKSLTDVKGSDPAAWQKQLSELGASEADYVDTIAVQQLAKALRGSVVKDTPVTDAAVEAQSAKDKATLYNVPAARKVVQILIGPADGSVPAAKDLPKYRAKAERVIKQLRRGVDMTTLVKQFSTDRRKSENDGGYDVTRSGFDQAFTTAAYALETGEFTPEPVRSAFGYT